MKHKLINGWTKEAMKQRIAEKNSGKCKNFYFCHYRLQGNACFVGVFIPDEAYSAKMEGKGAVKLLTLYPELKRYMPLGTNAIVLLQAIHDDYLGSSTEELHKLAFDWIDENVEESEK